MHQTLTLLRAQVALLSGKAKQRDAPPAQDAPLRRTASAGSQPAADSAVAQLHKAASSPAPYSRPGSAAAAGVTPEPATEAPPSCPASPSAEPFSLLPGYNSRPNISPVKKTPGRVDSPEQPQGGGFIPASPAQGTSQQVSTATQRSGSLHLNPAGEDAAQLEAAARRSGSGSAAQLVTAWAHASAQPTPDSWPPAAARGTKRENSLHADALWEELSKEMSAAPILQQQQQQQPEEQPQPAVDPPADHPADADQAQPRKRSRVAKPRRPPKSKFQVCIATAIRHSHASSMQAAMQSQGGIRSNHGCDVVCRRLLQTTINLQPVWFDSALKTLTLH